MKHLLIALTLCWGLGVSAASEPWKEVQKLTASDAAAFDVFGIPVTISGDNLFVGAVQEMSNGPGSVYLFERDSGAWVEVKKLTASDAEIGDLFGNSVSASGDTVVVGAFGADSGSGSAYVFERNQGGPDNWGQVKKLTASDAATGDLFGEFVTISGDTIAVGAELDDDAGDSSGSAYIFERNQGGPNNWGQVKKLTASDAAAGDQFGVFVTISGNTLVIGAWLDDAPALDSGSVYIFERNQGGADNWGELKKLTASDAAPEDSFGASIAIDGDTLIVGAVFDDSPTFDSGSAYVFERNLGGPTNWGEVTKIIATDVAPFSQFGSSISISGGTAVVGADQDDDPSIDSGSAYVFGRNQGGPDNWGEVTKLIASDSAAFDRFGSWVTISEDTVVVAAFHDSDDGTWSGSAYAFQGPLFADGFESGNTSAWSGVTGSR